MEGVCGELENVYRHCLPGTATVHLGGFPMRMWVTVVKSDVVVVVVVVVVPMEVENGDFFFLM